MSDELKYPGMPKLPNSPAPVEAVENTKYPGMPSFQEPAAAPQEGGGILNDMTDAMRKSHGSAYGLIGQMLMKNLHRGGAALSLPVAAAGDVTTAVNIARNLINDDDKLPTPDSYVMQSLQAIADNKSPIPSAAQIAREKNLPAGPSLSDSGLVDEKSPYNFNLRDALATAAEVAMPMAGVEKGVAMTGKGIKGAGNRMYDNAIRFLTREFKDYRGNPAINGERYATILKQGGVGRGADTAAEVEQQIAKITEDKVNTLDDFYAKADQAGAEADFAPGITAKEAEIKAHNAVVDDLTKAHAEESANMQGIIDSIADPKQKALVAKKLKQHLDDIKSQIPEKKTSYVDELKGRIADKDRTVREKALDELNGHLAPEFEGLPTTIKDQMLNMDTPEQLDAANRFIEKLRDGNRNVRQLRGFKQSAQDITTSSTTGGNAYKKGSQSSAKKDSAKGIAGRTNDMIDNIMEDAITADGGKTNGFRQANEEVSTMIRPEDALRREVKKQEGVATNSAIDGGLGLMAAVKAMGGNIQDALYATAFMAGKKGQKNINGLAGGTRWGQRLMGAGDSVQDLAGLLGSQGMKNTARASKVPSLWEAIRRDDENR